MQFLTLSTGTTHPEAAEPLVQFGIFKQSNGRRRYFGDTPTIMGSAVYVNVTHANTREEYMYIMNWRTCEDERLMDAQHFLMNYRFTFLDSEHSRTNNCPKTGCRTYRKSNDNQNLHFHIGNVDNCSSCSTTIMWHLGGRNCLSSQEPFYAHSIAIV